MLIGNVTTVEGVTATLAEDDVFVVEFVIGLG
jgi:hypothetical protein